MINSLLDRLPEEIIWRSLPLSLQITKSEDVWWGCYGGVLSPKIFDEIGDESFSVMLEKLYNCLKENNLLPIEKTG